MSDNLSRKSYFELTKHNPAQFIVFFALIGGAFLIVLFLFLPWLENFIKDFFRGMIYNHGEAISGTIDSKEINRLTDYYYAWGVDLYAKSPDQMRYWFNPTLAFFFPFSIIGLAVSVILTSLLPLRIGLIRHKIEREIANYLDKISQIKYGYHLDNNRHELVEEILNTDLRQLHDLAELWKLPFEDLNMLYKALIWQESNTLFRIFRINHGLRIYMRSYFTVKYSNTVLGFVYIGAAVLIIIIGLRGLKFIPPTQPSLVLFSLGLEFSLLLTYAFTLMYSRQEEELQSEGFNSRNFESLKTKGDFGNQKEIENLLRVFIKGGGQKKK
ncbi:MAG: hypothetical protein QG635_5 [Bacteroidota bacterium]|nr:hypothetical protein [Bacteroidota bacterium]